MALVTAILGISMMDTLQCVSRVHIPAYLVRYQPTIVRLAMLILKESMTLEPGLATVPNIFSTR